MARRPPPEDVLREVVSTFTEFHYLAVGFALGVVVGVRLALRWARRYHAATA